MENNLEIVAATRGKETERKKIEQQASQQRYRVEL